MTIPSCRYPCDLHTHTNRSDGSDTPAELIAHAAAAGVKVIAITDHDIVPPETVTVDGKELPLAEYAAKMGVRVIPGIEISCDTDVEDVHIVCLGCDFHAPFFKELEEEIAASKIESYHLLLQALTAAGMPLTWEDILCRDGKTLSKDSVQKKMIFEAMALKGYAPSWQEAKLLVKNTPTFQIKRRKPSPIGVLANIKKAGGFAILAHPYLISDTISRSGGVCISRADYIDELIRAGLTGIEACYTYDKTSYDGALSPAEIEKEVRERYENRLPVISGGSDYHADFKKGVANFRYLGEAGITEEAFYSNEFFAGLF